MAVLPVMAADLVSKGDVVVSAVVVSPPDPPLVQPANTPSSNKKAIQRVNHFFMKKALTFFICIIL